ncbi:MAG: DUF2163 domain-containing protein [Pontixanthobacter sp.]
MTRAFLNTELDSVATFWRILRRDGVSLGFTGHDRALWFGGILHRAAPGMVPSAIRLSDGLAADSAEVRGVLSHASIRRDDLRAGRYDDAYVIVGAVDWTTRDHRILYRGALGSIAEEGAAFTAELRSAKALLDRDTIPRTSPTCRAQFCGPGCNLSSARFDTEAIVTGIEAAQNAVRFGGIAQALYSYGTLRWIGGADAGRAVGIAELRDDALVLDTALPVDLEIGARARLRQGCDHTIATCAARFGNAANFQGEPFLPGNDRLARYPLQP